MAGHSKWANIKHRKAAQDKKKGKILTKYSKLIIVAAKEGGGDPDNNPSLKMVIQKAKKEGVPNDNIERAIKSGTGELKDGAEIKEVIYEGYGPDGVAFLIETLTDNTNRTLTNVKTILSKNGGSLGKSGSVAYQFDRKGVFVFDSSLKDEIEEFAIMHDAEDLYEDEDALIVYTSKEDYVVFSNAVDEAGFDTQTAELQFVPNMEKEIGDTKIAEKILKLIDLLEDDDDVQAVHTNANFM